MNQLRRLHAPFFLISNRWAVSFTVVVLVGLALVFSSNVATAAISLTHRYSFNDGSADDSIGSSDGTLINGASIEDGKLVLGNNGVNTDPVTGQYVSLPDNILHTQNFTLETWFTFNGGNAWQRLFDVGNSVPDPTHGYIGQGFIILTMGGALWPLGQISINSWGGGGDTQVAYGVGVAFPKGGEHSLVYTHNTDTRTEALYLDGVKIGSSTSTITVDPATTNFSNFWIGRSQFSQDPFYNGSIDEMRTYNDSMTSTEVLASYRAGPEIVAVPEPASLVLFALGASLAWIRYHREGLNRSAPSANWRFKW